ncbi:DUF4153 domain-containing protein [Flavobacterium sp. K5-23]|uniref:DUF4153 domain-containing protein n=1 Tax=Flavobacterium sp. K5-23 TaxID=2746225 RepID=UPI00200BF7F5|nr:DUF4153 domain-containing protein [Flavobacterium sp. K5-23]UQD55945.1 DUF4153 domain-containing protein [Flavobacterium sp. K5-23]
MARFPSFQKIIDNTLSTISRFPLETVTTVLGTIMAIYLSEEHSGPMEKIYLKTLLCCSLCLALFLSITLYFSRDLKNNALRFGSSIILGSIIVLFVFNFSNPIKTYEIYQFLALNLGLHLLVSFAAFIHKKYDPEAFWEFNKQLFLRILTAGLYSMVIYAGLSFALLAINLLFEIKFYDKIYVHLFLIIAGIFNTLFFLTGVPETNDSKAPLALNYPIGLKKFTQYVLVPLISIYLVILLSYELKIIATFSLPIGWVSNLILVFAVFGILSLLLIYPIAKDVENVWIRTFHKWFYYLLVPLLGLLFWAILYRIDLYGFTHERYFVFALALWLSLLTAYFIFKKNPEIKFIPITMCVIALLTIIGPQSADSVSKRSQLNRFKEYIVDNKKTKLTYKEEQDLSSIIEFINDHYGIEALAPLSLKINQLAKKDKEPSSFAIMEALGYKYRRSYRGATEAEEPIYYHYYNNDDGGIAEIKGYDFAFELNNNNNYTCKNCVQWSNKPYSINYTSTDYGVALKINDDVIPIKINNFIKTTATFKAKNNNKKITQRIITSKYELLLQYESVTINYRENETTIDAFNIKTLLKIKK